MKTPTATKAKPATTPRTLKIQPFTVTTQWVSVTTSILARHAERMQSVPYYQTDSLRFGGQLVKSYHTTKTIHDNQGLEHECLIWGNMTGRRLSPITFAIEAERWAEIETLAKRINSTPAAFVRAAIAKAAKGWARFDETADKTARQAAA